MAELDYSYLGNLVEIAKSGNSDAFAELFAATYQKQYAFAYCYLNDSVLSRDALRETYTTVLKNLRTLKDPKLFIAWLNQINFRICYAIANRQSKKKQEAEAAAAQAAASDAAEGNARDQVVKIDDKSYSMQQILALPYSESQTIFLYYYKKMKINAIADMLEMSRSSVKRHLADGKQRLEESGIDMTWTRSDVSTISEDDASKVLQDVFDICQQEANTIPLSKLVYYSEYRKERYGVQKFLLIVVLVLFLALPLCFVSPQFTISKAASTSQDTTAYVIQVDNKLPVSRVAASVDGAGLVVSEVSDHVYSVTPTRNGVMKVVVWLINQQYSVTEVKISGIDNAPPVLISDEIKDGKLYLEVKDEGSGIDYDGVYAEIGSSGEKVSPVSAEDGLLVFELPEGSADVYIPDLNGNTRVLVVSLYTDENEDGSEVTQEEVTQTEGSEKDAVEETSAQKVTGQSETEQNQTGQSETKQNETSTVTPVPSGDPT